MSQNYNYLRNNRNVRVEKNVLESMKYNIWKKLNLLNITGKNMDEWIITDNIDTIKL